ncbi:hypothetical protein [Mycoplasma sp. Mirounga ES2805-ORL]|uniref:hypothetical protein n=1 Tax=Mycoplasma sp. Mirounga ES2805-ORL TaxID=754514 RepID=UPI00197C9E58|nr:hypothetical protein [Mycoplasma sp. Mirounga ES2805-ORL]QSF13967.1 hypothetical protein JXZ90_01615 [Mycoplasma sp. Mirounga ES2805-ORL]
MNKMKLIKNKNLIFKNKELKKPSDVVGDVSFNYSIEFLKFIIILLLSAAVMTIHYQHSQEKSSSVFFNFLRKIYIYSFGQVFGDLVIFILVGSYFTFATRWLSVVFKKYYFRWFKNYTRVDYWILKKRIITFIWLNLLAFAIIYHAVLVSLRVNNAFYYKPNELKLIFTKGWVYSFSGSGKDVINFPICYGNVGIVFDTIFNILHCAVLSPFLSIFIIILIILLSWFWLVTLNPIKYFRELNTKKKNLIMIENYLKKPNSIFYYTDESKKIFDFYKKASSILKLDHYKFSFDYIIKQVNKNIDLFANHNLTKDFFIKKNIKISKDERDEQEFTKILLTKQNGAKDAANVMMPNINFESLVNGNGNESVIFDTTEKTLEQSAEFSNSYEYSINEQGNVVKTSTTTINLNLGSIENVDNKNKVQINRDDIIEETNIVTPNETKEVNLGFELTDTNEIDEKTKTISFNEDNLKETSELNIGFDDDFTDENTISKTINIKYQDKESNDMAKTVESFIPSKSNKEKEDNLNILFEDFDQTDSQIISNNVLLTKTTELATEDDSDEWISPILEDNN